MPAYIIAEIEVTDPGTYAGYRARTPEAIARHGGRFLVRGGTVLPVEGAPPAGRVVVIEFADMEAARRFYGSPDYQAILPLRQAASRGRLFIVEGVAP
ncbi:DUF1330 domain-containing protein [Marinimicrococcus flavescens]|uniref:DUF1330 domain-containing protein n=1 Tax=Marinimicrococcus flavescens TaxID=3031815 RepID=A0AAP3XQ15_9PROT|nr:DUF1330 domain-containing protein [Marinimicrococcus flavescens]